jgi:hypothetical protein
VPDPCQIVRGTTGNRGPAPGYGQAYNTTAPQVSAATVAQKLELPKLRAPVPTTAFAPGMTSYDQRL